MKIGYLLLSAGFLGLSVYVSDLSVILQISTFSTGAGLFVMGILGLDFYLW